MYAYVNERISIAAVIKLVSLSFEAKRVIRVPTLNCSLVARSTRIRDRDRWVWIWYLYGHEWMRVTIIRGQMKETRNAWATLVSAERSANWARPICRRPSRLISNNNTYRVQNAQAFSRTIPWQLRLESVHVFLSLSSNCRKEEKSARSNEDYHWGVRMSELIGGRNQKVEFIC